MINKSSSSWKPWILLFSILSVGISLYFYSGLGSQLNFQGYVRYRTQLQAFRDENLLLCAGMYTLLFCCIVLCSIPGATFITFTAGVLFPQPYATACAVTGATCGACGSFYLASTTFGKALRNRVQKNALFSRIESYFKKDVISSMMLLRLVPIFPFWFMNITPSVFGVSFKTFALTTFFGILPGSWVYTEAGRGLDEAISVDENLTTTGFLMKAIFRRNMILSVSVLLLWLCGLLVFRMRRTKSKSS